jgi:hypothetical protein
MSDSQQVPGGARGLAADHLRSLLGRRIQHIGYKIAGESASDLGVDYAAFVHEVGHAVVITTEATTTVLEWCIRSYDEFLNIVTAPDSADSAAVSQLLDATNLPQWRPFLDAPISGFGVATHQAENGADLLWALRIESANGAAAVVALGEERDGVLTYQPDNLLVIFQPELAQELQVVDAPDSAWGRDLTL